MDKNNEIISEMWRILYIIQLEENEGSNIKYTRESGSKEEKVKVGMEGKQNFLHYFLMPNIFCKTYLCIEEVRIFGIEESHQLYYRLSNV